MSNAIILLAGCAALLIAKANSETIPSAHTTHLFYLWCVITGFSVLAFGMRAHARKVGGLTFLRLGRFQLSFCITSK